VLQEINEYDEDRLGNVKLDHKRGRETIQVQCMNINSLLAKVKPTIIKMNIEGGEYECIRAIKDWSGINQIILEFHHNHLNDIKTHKKYREITSLLKQKFEKVDAKEDPKGSWVSIIYCNNSLSKPSLDKFLS
jgi:hypothetical protein